MTSPTLESALHKNEFELMIHQVWRHGEAVKMSQESSDFSGIQEEHGAFVRHHPHYFNVNGVQKWASSNLAPVAADIASHVGSRLGDAIELFQATVFREEECSYDDDSAETNNNDDESMNYSKQRNATIHTYRTAVEGLSVHSCSRTDIGTGSFCKELHDLPV